MRTNLRIAKSDLCGDGGDHRRRSRTSGWDISLINAARFCFSGSTGALV